eukprot:908848-Rhodomonas_salina.1
MPSPLHVVRTVGQAFVIELAVLVLAALRNVSASGLDGVRFFGFLFGLNQYVRQIARMELRPLRQSFVLDLLQSQRQSRVPLHFDPVYPAGNLLDCFVNS